MFKRNNIQKYVTVKISTIGKLFPHVDFSDCQTNMQNWPNSPPTPNDNINIFHNKLNSFKENNVAIVTHHGLNFDG